MQHVLMVVVWPANFFFVRHSIVQTEFTGVADLNNLTAMLGQYTQTEFIIYIFLKSVYNNQNYTYQLYLTHNYKTVWISYL